MKKGVIVLVCVLHSMVYSKRCSAQDPITEVIRQAVIKVIKAVDLKIQRLQNKTIWLQNAQKAVENKMQELKLGEISDWVERQRILYADYYEELWKVKAVISRYEKIRDVIQQQVTIMEEYKKAMALFHADKQLTQKEIVHIQNVYSGILKESLKNLDGLYLVVNSFATEMSDGQRLELIDEASKRGDVLLSDLRKFTERTVRLRLQRARDEKEILIIKKLYGVK